MTDLRDTVPPPVEGIDYAFLLEYGMFASEDDSETALASDWSEITVRDVLLLNSTTLLNDYFQLKSKLTEHSDEELDNWTLCEFWRRLIRYVNETEELEQQLVEDALDFIPPPPPYPWEGITWVIDLAEFSPNSALRAISSYLEAHFWILPEGHLGEPDEAAALIRARYIRLPHTEDRVTLLTGHTPRDLERLTAILYRRMGYEVTLTKQSGDGGKDVIAVRAQLGQREKTYIECKRWEDPVGISIVQRMAGVIARDATRGVIITTSQFTPQARAVADRHPNLELIDGEQFVLLLNEHLGPIWPLRLKFLLAMPPQEAEPRT